MTILSSNSSLSARFFRYRWWIGGVALVAAIWSILSAVADGGGGGGGGGRKLFEFQETQGNASFQCSPSGSCVRCQYSEKNDEVYRCSETGYHRPLKCVKVQEDGKDGSNEKFQRRFLSSKHKDKLTSLDVKTGKAMPSRFLYAIRPLKRRILLGTSLESGNTNSKQSYITYRSCLPAVPDEKLSFIGFEAFMLCLLLVSGPIAYFRQKRSTVVAGVAPTRVPTNLPRL